MCGLSIGKARAAWRVIRRNVVEGETYARPLVLALCVWGGVSSVTSHWWRLSGLWAVGSGQ